MFGLVVSGLVYTVLVCVYTVLQVCVCKEVYVYMCMVTGRVFVLENKVTSRT
jgi:hypothetical protein